MANAIEKHYTPNASRLSTSIHKGYLQTASRSTIIRFMTVSGDHVAGAKESFVLPHDSIDSIIRINGKWVDFSNGLIADDRSKLRDSHVIDFLSHPNHIDTQKVTIINLCECKGITDGSLVAYITDHCPQFLETLYAYNCNISALPDDFGLKLKRLQALYLQNNNITTLPASIGNLAGTCTQFRIDRWQPASTFKIESCTKRNWRHQKI